RLPEPMVPAAFVVLPALPLTPNGKVDRRALARLEPGPKRGFEAPRTPAEERLARLWAEVLGAERVGRGDDFFALGGHSLLATRLALRVRESFGVELPLAAFFEHPRLSDLAAALERMQAAEDLTPRLVAVPRDSALPLSFAQERLWFLDRLAPGRAVYNIPAAIRLSGALDAEALAGALDDLAAQHEVLRTVFPAVEGEP